MIWAAVLQIVSPLERATLDLSTLATRAEMAAAEEATRAAAKAAADQAAAALVAAQAACQPTPGIPPTETVGGSAGSGSACRLANAVQPRISRTVSGTTGAGGVGSVTWAAVAPVPKLTVTPYVGSTAAQAPMCFPVSGTVTSTGATIKCFTTQSVTVSILGAVVAPITTAASGVAFDVLVLPPS